MTTFNLYCRNATTFAPDGSFDEEAFRQYLQRFIDARIGVYLASLGSGESGSMTLDELRRVYRIGVEVCKGRIPVHANPPEKMSVRETFEHVQLAVEAGVEIVNVYGPAAWHGYQPTPEEFFAFFDELLPKVKAPVAFSPNAGLGRAPTAAMLARLCEKHPQIIVLNLLTQTDEYFVELQDRLTREVQLNVPFMGSMETMLLGATAVIGAEMNMLPKTHRRYMDLFTDGRHAEAAQVYADIARFNRYVGQWRSAHPRWIKMMMTAFKIPGGMIRGPYVPPAAEEQQRFVDGLLALGLAEIGEAAREAGLAC
ncbi:MAG TPA: dihydrodipicolinate synthase family protein [Bordetella sp.]|nr:dihydrodipicolinate synthase family protein [Bordetella sp.]